MGRPEASTIRSLEEIGRDRWQELVADSEVEGTFHSYEFIRALEEGGAADPYHTVVRKDGNLIGAMPSFLYEMDFPGLRYLMSFNGRGGPIILTDEEDVLSEMIRNSSRIAGRTGAMFQDVSAEDRYFLRYNSMFLDNGYSSNVAITRKVLDLTQGLDEIENGIRNRSKRKRFAKFRGQELEVGEPDRQDLLDFHDRFRRYQEREAVMPRKTGFFTRLERMSDDLRIARVFNDGEVSGEHLYVLDGDRMYHLLTGIGTGYREYNATERIHAAMIERAMEEGFRTYDFGTSSADFRKGVFNFKDEYGAENRPILGWRKVYSKTRYRFYRLASKVK